MTAGQDPSRTDVVACECGARVRLPAGAGARVFLCPQCKREIGRPTARSAESSQASATAVDPTGKICPICQTTIAAGEPAMNCPQCDQAHHQECWTEVGGCGTYGCQKAHATEEKQAVAPPLSAWGDNKRCPICGEQIKAIAVKCRYCGSAFDTVDPLTLADVRKKIHRSDAMENLHKVIVALFVLSLFGCLAPIVTILGSCVVIPKHARLAREGPLYLVLGYAAIGLSVVYSLLMVGFALF